MAKLIFIDEAFAGRTFDFPLAKTTVGRSTDNTLVLHHDSVSHHHCEILVNGNEVIVHDLGSKNGTFVEGRRLSNEQSQIKNGQVVRFGTVGARLELDATTHGASDTATGITAIYALDKFEKQKRKQQKQASTRPQSMELGSGDDADDQTVTIQREERPKRITTPLAPEDLGKDPAKSTWKIVLILAVVLVAGLAFVLWRFFKEG